MQTTLAPTSLPAQLLQALTEIEVAPQRPGQAAGGEFWLRLAAQLEQLEPVAAVLPGDLNVDHLANWLAAGLGGDGLPDDGNALPLPPGLVLDAIDAQSGAAAPDPLRQLAAAVHAAALGAPWPLDPAASAAPGRTADAQPSDLRAWLGETLAQLRLAGGAPLAEGGPIPVTSPSALPSGAGFAGADGAEALPQAPGQALPMVPGRAVSEPFLTESRGPEPLTPGALPAGAAADGGGNRGVLESMAQAVRSAEAVPQPAAAVAATQVVNLSAPEAGGNAQAASVNPAGPRAFTIAIPLQQPGWDRAFGNGVRWMVNQNVQVAELRLSPPHLGPLEVRLQVEGDRTHLNIVAPHAATREAVEAALPRLREMFAESGLNLGDVNVRQDSTGRGGAQADASGVPGAAGDRIAEGDGPGSGSRGGAAPARQGLVDYYA